jgi:hypothetical protein
MASKLTGDWKKAGLMLQWLTASLSPICHARLYEDGELIVKRMVEHIDRQDLPWKPLSDVTIAIKGNSQVYVDTGWLKENLSVRRMKTSPLKSTVFVGASPWKTHKPSGKKFSELMIMLEYGTDEIPARPLIRPTWEEMKKEIESGWQKMFKDVLRKGAF